MATNLIRIPSASYKAYEQGEFCAVNIWKVPQTTKGKFNGNYKYRGIFVPFRVAHKLNKLKEYNQDDEILREFGKPHPSARFVMNLFKKDMVALKMSEDLKAKLEKKSGSGIPITPVSIDSTDFMIVTINSFLTQKNQINIFHQYSSNRSPINVAIPELLKTHGMRKLSVFPTGKYKLHAYKG